MKITCPNCTTTYQVPDDYIGSKGRAVRCAQCGDTWHATADLDEDKSLDAALDTSRDDPTDMMADGSEQSQDDIDALFDSPSGGGEDQSQDDIDALFDSPSGGGEDQSQDDIDALFDSPSGGGEDQSQDDIDALFDSPSGAGDDQSQDDIDALFDSPGSNEAEKTVPTSPPKTELVTSRVADGLDEDVVEAVDAAAFEAQKAIAQGKAGNDIESAVRRRRGKGRKPRRSAAAKTAGVNDRKDWIVGGSALAASLVMVAGLLMAPALVVRTVPSFASLYDFLGMPVNLSGVVLQDVSAQLLQRSGAPVISINASLVNDGGEPVLLPKVQLSVLGNDDVELYAWAIEPDGVGLGPGETKDIATRIAAPAQAKKVSLRVTKTQ